MNIIWVVLIFFIVSFISPGERCNKIFDFVQRKWNIFAWLERLKISRWYKISSVGWLLFSVYWFSLLSEYFEGDDYVNVVLTVLVGFLCILIAIRIIGDDKEGLWKSLTMWVTISGLIYLPFSEIPVLKDTLISIVTNQTVSLLELFGVHTQLVSATNTILLNGLSVEIVLGCTAIESMAFFAGLIFCVNAPLKRKLLAFIFVPIIYIANLFRNSFVIYAYGNQLFQFG
ncbi:MAG: archaeosortase A, partial [Candidatus Methanolliviera hydrocarbonicum]